VSKTANTDIWQYHTEAFDTLLLMMNGIGLVETIQGLRNFLRYAKTLISDSGQVLLDSSDIAYLYDESHPYPKDKYYGEIRYQYEYKGRRGTWFGWLYADQETLFNIAAQEGWLMQVIYENDDDQYLARLIMTDKRL
ncbi:MAG TPA: SAM-dependent methyltransferase, partial [Sphingobacteriaceae bacterium]